MKSPIRVTVALDEETADLFDQMRKEMRISQSFYVDMLGDGEHIILDVDHWLLFLKIIDSLPEDDGFWEKCRTVAESHAEQLSEKIATPKSLLRRLEACNFFKLVEDGKNEFTLVLGSDLTVKFVKRLIKDLSESMGFSMDIKEGIAKIRVRVNGKDR
ncbi:MAG: ribbon-helix-helix protein, CopG family [Candidatus Syntropharchaeia archaeon]